MSAGFPSPTVTPLSYHPGTRTHPTFRFLCSASWTCWSTPGTRHTFRQACTALITTGEALSVVPLGVAGALDLVVGPPTGWTTAAPEWRGIPCRVGRLEMWLPVQGTLSLRRFPVLALLPRQATADELPYVYLGLQFLIEHQGAALLGWSQSRAKGQLSIP